MDLRNGLYVMDDAKRIYKVYQFRELDSNEYGLLYDLELVAGYDYINPDENDVQGFIGAENFVDDVQVESITVYPLSESLGERLDEEGFKVIDINDYKIFKGMN